MLPDAESRLSARDDLAASVLAQNRAAGRKIAVAESCTGGMVAAALTDIAGCSDVFTAGFVTYSADAKKRQLDVSGEILETFGEVSLATAWAMAGEQRRRRRGRDHGHRRSRRRYREKAGRSRRLRARAARARPG